jgi:hypothetical protein
VLNHALDINFTVYKAYDLIIGKGIGYNFEFFSGYSIVFSSLKTLLIFISLYLLVYCMIVQSHVQYSNLLVNKVFFDTKKKILEKTFLIKNSRYKKERILNDFDGSIKSFSEMVFFIPNQIFYFLLSTLLGFFRLFREKPMGKKELMGGVFS